MKKITFLVLIITIITVFFLAGCSSDDDSPLGPGKYDTFAQCLTEKGVKMYGAYWCSHCQNQKEQFGPSWQYVNYIECSLPGGRGQTAQCEQAGITGYPTWEFGDGSRGSGEQTFEELSQNSGCPLS